MLVTTGSLIPEVPIKSVKSVKSDYGQQIGQTDLWADVQETTIDEKPEPANDRQQPHKVCDCLLLSILTNQNHQVLYARWENWVWPEAPWDENWDITQSQHEVVFTRSPSIMQNGSNLCHSQNEVLLEQTIYNLSFIKLNARINNK